MFIIKSIALLKQHIAEQRTKLNEIGFVPTMGALHQGHLNLIAESKRKNCYTVCSIYVNPTQFNNLEDFEKYPSTIEQDITKLTDSGCDLLFLPSSDEMYGDDVVADRFDFGLVTNSYEGALRPGHFNGVITIVSKLFDAVLPQQVFFGQKDLQQCMVVKHLINEKYPSIKINIINTTRELSGLAMSSRNVRLSSLQKDIAVNISKALFFIKQQLVTGVKVFDAIEQAKRRFLTNSELELEYLAVVDVDTMQEAHQINNLKTYAAIIACKCGNIRLIDNVLLTNF